MILEISTLEAETYALEYYGIQGKAKRLAGYEDINFQLKLTDGTIYLLKVSKSDIDTNFLELQTNILLHIANHTLNFEVPKPIRNLNNQYYFSIEKSPNEICWIRMNTWVEGDIVYNKKYHPADLLKNWGKTCASLDTILLDFDISGLGKSHDWDLSLSLNNRAFRTYLKEEKQLKIADYFWDLFEKEVLPIYPKLEKQVIHCDINDFNLLANNDLENPIITGVIDFGDVVYSYKINELAIACAYAMMFKPNPLEAAMNLVKGYHSVSKLLIEELEILYILIGNRLLTTVSNAAKNHHLFPENEYLFVSELPAWNVLYQWFQLSQNLVYYSFRSVCDFEPCPKNILFKKVINANNNLLKPVVNFDQKSIVKLDLSVGSLDLGNNSNFENTYQSQKRINDILWEKEAEIGIGGYGEIRPFYNSDAYISNSNSGRQWRTVHLGWDVWTKAKTAVYSALDGIVYSIKDNKGDDNYGPTIILKHQIEQESERLIFYTLYGHLSPISEQLKVGQKVKQGQQIATIGTYPQNGNWAEHLHFQIILDMLEQEGDFYGVCTPMEKEIWLSICPNPETIFFPNRAEIFNKETYYLMDKTILKKRKTHLGKNLSLSYQEPLHIIRAYKQYLYDTNGRRYLDTANNVPHIGHQHPKVTATAKRQLEVLNTNTRYLHENIVNYAEALLATFPEELSVCYFVNSGSEANELALRMAKTVTGQKNMIAVEVGYHGNTNETIAVSSYKFDSKGGSGKPSNTHIVPIPDVFRGKYQDIKLAGELYAKSIEDRIVELQEKGENIASFICESILSCGGQIILPPNYLKIAYEYVRKAGGICIADEVQVGFGRVGETFWGFELQEVIPDIVSLGKPIGNGHPLAAVVTTRRIADAFDNGMEYFNTFGGNPVSCAIGQTVLEVIEEERLQENALEIGRYLKDKFTILKSKYPIIGDVRGYGLFLGIELIRNLNTLEPADTEAAFIVNKMKERAILMSIDGPLHNVLKIKPPMCFSKQDADFLLETFETVCQIGDFKV